MIDKENRVKSNNAMNNIDVVLNKEALDHEDLVYLLSLEEQSDLEKLFDRAYEVKVKEVEDVVYYRGLIEFSNYCIKNCYYCGIRKDNNVNRFDMDLDEVEEMAIWAYENEYGSVTLQAGERTDQAFIDFCTTAIKIIKEVSNGELGITLSLGEQTYETYKTWREAGAHRYLLRIETTDQELYQSLHPNDELHDFNHRVNCLKELAKLDYQVGTGVMIGLPGQTVEMLANDIEFYKDMNIDMIGMGPYIVSSNTPTGDLVLSQNKNEKSDQHNRFMMGLKMIAVTRLYLKDVNIAATTALQALNPLGREKGLKAGANILMPIITLKDYRADYQLYDDKPCIDDTPNHCKGCLGRRVASVGDTIGYGKLGDSKHYLKNKNYKQP